MASRPKVRTCLWFDDQALEAATFYCSLLPESRVERVGRHAEDQESAKAGDVLMVEFTLGGTPYQALNGGPHFVLSEAVSISVVTEDQAETDRLWEALTADGGSESRCGWLKDRFGLSWQIVPKRLVELLGSKAGVRVMPALRQMKRINIAALEAAAEAK